MSDSSKMQPQKNNLNFVEDELQCSICAEIFVNAVTLSCSHSFCKFCITQWQKNKTLCPICRTQITVLSPTLVLDNFIEKMLENASEEVKEHRREIITAREAATPSTSQLNRRRPADEPMEINSSSDDDSDWDDDLESDYMYDDWYDYDDDDDDSEDDDDWHDCDCRHPKRLRRN